MNSTAKQRADLRGGLVAGLQGLPGYLMLYIGAAYAQKPDDTDNFRHAPLEYRSHASEEPCKIDVYFTLCISGRTTVLIPNHTHEGVLPPFIPGATPKDPGAVAPYRTELLEFAGRFSGTAERKAILSGLVAYRTALRAVGIMSGFQWLDGSFVEDCESIRGRAPKDIDLITFSFRPKTYADTAAWRELVHTRPDLFDPETTKAIYKCDAYFVDLGVHPVHVVAQTRYWFGLFSHQRDTYLWKGMIEVPLTENDADVESLLRQEVNDAS